MRNFSKKVSLIISHPLHETYYEKFLKKVKKARQDKQTDILKIYISKII